MTGNSRTNDKSKASASANSLMEATNGYANSSFSNAHPPGGLTFLEGNVEEDPFDSLLDMASSFAELEEFHRSVAQGIPETVADPRGYSMNLDNFQNPHINMSSNSVNTNLQGVSLSPDWNMSWGQQYVNQGHNAISASGISTFGGESSFVSLNRPQGNRDITGSSLLIHPRELAPVHTRNDASFNQSQRGIQGNFEGSFLSLGIGGGTEESVSRSQLGSGEISDELKETASNELKMVRARKAMRQTLDAGFMGFQSNNSGLSNKFCQENRMTSTNNEAGLHGSLNSWPGSSLQHILHVQQNDMQHDKNTRSGDLDHFRDEKIKEAVSTELNMIHARKATGQTSGQSLNAGFMGFPSNTSGFSNQFGNMERMNSTNEVGILGTLDSGLGTSPHHILQIQQNGSRNIRSGDLDHYRVLLGNQPVHIGTIGGNSAQDFNSQQHNLKKPPKVEKPSWLAPYHTPSEQLQYMRSATANSPSYAGQVISQNANSGQVLGSDMFSQRRAASQASWVDSGDAGFPKRLGVEFNVRNILQTNQRHSSPVETSLQTTSTDQVCQFPDKGLTRLTDHVHWPSIGRTDGAPVINSQEPFYAHGQSQNAVIQLAKGPQGAPSANASTVGGQSQKPDLHIRRHHKRSAVVPHPASPWVQRQKITHPTSYHSMPKPSTPVTTPQIHPSVPAGSPTLPACPVAAHIRSAVPCPSSVKSRVPVTTAPVRTAPAVAHITRKDPEAASKLSGYKCLLCKRDLALTSEGPVYQPAAPPPVAILPCGHTFHDQCLQNITPNDQAKDPPCIPCAIGEQ